MKTEIKEVGSVTIISPKGKITIGKGDVRLREAIEGQLEAGRMNLLIDLGRVSYMDSSGVGELVGCYTTVVNRGGMMKLLNLTKKIHDLLQITQLVTVFELYKDETEAIASF